MGYLLNERIQRFEPPSFKQILIIDIIALAGGTLQAWRGSGFRARLCLSGVTPGKRVDLTFRRKTDAAPRAELVMQGETRWRVPPIESMKNSPLLGLLATSLLAGEPTVDQASARLAQTLGRRWRWLRPLAKRYVKAFAGHVRPHRREVTQFLRQDRGLQQARAKYRDEISIAHWLAQPQIMQPVPAAARWNIPPIESVGALAERLGMTVTDLLWLADLKGLASKIDRPLLQHYHYRVLPKPSGRIRLIEIPKPRLKDVQRHILFHILNKIPPHPAAHGFVKAGPSKALLLRMSVGASFCVWICGISSPPFPLQESQHSSGRRATQNRWPTCSPDYVRLPRLGTSGRNPPVISTARTCMRRGISTRSRICHRVPQHRRRSPISAPIAWTADSLAWQSHRAPSTRATPTIWLSPELKHSEDTWTGSRSMSRPSC